MSATADIERVPREDLEALQLERLRATVDRTLAAATPLSARLRDAGVGAGADVAALGDLRRLPFVTKEDLREHYPTGLFAVPRERIVRLHASSGTGGKPTVVGYTAADLDMWAEVVARCMARCGVRPGMVVHNANGYGLFTGGLGFHAGTERLGATIVPISTGRTRRQAMLIRDLGAEVITCTPSYALNIADAFEEAGVAPGDQPLEIGLFGAEPWSESMRRALESRLGLRARNVYGLSEIVGPGVSAECEDAPGGSHVNEDHFLPEIVDPASGEPVAGDRPGELVLTTLTKEGLPLIRYRTADITTLTAEPCPCGRTLCRMGPVLGRRDDMLIVRGVNVYPSEIEQVLLEADGLAPYWELRIERPGAMDEVTARCETARAHAGRDDLAGRVRAALRERTGIAIAVELVAPGTVPRSEGKAVRVVDLRRA